MLKKTRKYQFIEIESKKYSKTLYFYHITTYTIYYHLKLTYQKILKISEALDNITKY